MSHDQSPNQPALNQPALPEMTVIGPDTRIKGEMFFEKSARILGQFEGKIIAQGEVQIGNGAECNAAVEAQRIVVDGKVNGPIAAHDRLTLTENAQVQGDITAGTLVVAEGASFVGNCNVGPRAQEILKNSPNATTTKPALATEPKGSIGHSPELTPPWATQAAGNVA